MRGFFDFLRIVFASVLLCATARADEPTLTHLKPAGMQRGTTQTIECFGKFEWPIRVDCQGASIKCLEEKGKLSVTVDGAIASDRVWLRLYDASGASAAVPLLIGELPDVAEVEPNDAPGEAQPIPSSSEPIACTIDGVLEKNGDVDGYAVKLAAGETLVAMVEANAAFESPMDAIMQVALPDGTVVDENHDFRGLDPGLAFQAATEGTYVVRVFAWPSNPNQQIRYHGAANFVYRLTLTTGPYITHSLTPAVASSENQNVPLVGWNMPSDSTGHVEPLAILNQSFESQWQGQLRAGSTVGIVRMPGMAGSARVLILDDRWTVNTSTTDRECTMNSVHGGWIRQPGDTHVYTIALRKDQMAEFAVEAVNLNSDLVPHAQIKDASGKVLQESPERGAAADALLSFKAPADGEYSLTIGDRFSSGGPRHFYRLSVVEPVSGFRLTTTNDRFVVTKEKPLEIPIEIVRTVGSDQAVGDISFTVEGLPDGTHAEAVVSSASGESKKKVVIKLTTDGRAFSGPIRIIGSAATNDLKRAVQSPERFGARFEQLWLTVVASN